MTAPKSSKPSKETHILDQLFFLGQEVESAHKETLKNLKRIAEIKKNGITHLLDPNDDVVPSNLGSLFSSKISSL